MITLRTGSYTKTDLVYLLAVIERSECNHPSYKLCDECEMIHACTDLQRLKAHIQKLLNERSFSEK